MKLLLGLRTFVFYLGYVGSLVVHSLVSVAAGVFMPVKARFRFFLLWNRFIMWWLKVTCGVRVRFQGTENVPSGPCVIVSNHQSPWETLYFIFHFMPACAILKKELLSIPFFGWGLRMLQPIAIDRSRKRQAMDMIIAQGRQRLADGISVIVFPEGTRVAPGEIKRFSTGGAQLALAAGVPILPVAHNAGLYWPARRLMKYPGTIDVRIGPPIFVTDTNAREATRAAEEWIRGALGDLAEIEKIN